MWKIHQMVTQVLTLIWFIQNIFPVKINILFRKYLATLRIISNLEKCSYGLLFLFSTRVNHSKDKRREKERKIKQIKATCILIRISKRCFCIWHGGIYQLLLVYKGSIFFFDCSHKILGISCCLWWHLFPLFVICAVAY